MSEEVSKQFDEKYCSSCGKPMKIAAELCPNCGVRALSDKKWIATLLLFIFLPSVHRFYVGKIGTGILFILTAGGLGIWWIIDLITILCGNFKDKYGKPIK